MFVDTDIDLPSGESLQIMERRRFMYSSGSLQLARRIEDIHLVHQRFSDALTGFDRIFQLATAKTARGMLLSGAWGTGKTTLIKYFEKSLPHSTLFEKGVGSMAIRLPYKPSAGQFISASLKRLGYPLARVTKTTLYAKRDLLFELVRDKGVRLFFVDQGHNLATQYKPRDAQSSETPVTDMLCHMMDEAGVGVVVTTDGSMPSLKGVDDGLDSRIACTVKLEDFQPGEVWQKVLGGFAKNFGDIDLSILRADPVAAQTHTATSGNFRRLKYLLSEFVLVAAEDGAAALEQGHMKLAFERVFGKDSGRTNPYGA